MMRIARLFVLSIAALAGCADLDTSVTSQGNHSWGGYHWARTSNPFTLKVGDNVTSAWDSYLNTSIGDWSQSTVLDLTKVTGQATNKRCSPTAGRVEVCNNTYGNNGWLGIAGISITGGTHITQGYVKLNDTYYNSATYNTPAWRNLVMCQEIGHTFGLDHQDENFSNANLGTCMDYTNDPSTNQHPNSHDMQQLQTIYQHLDSTTTVGLAVSATAMADDEEEGPARWGEVVRELPNGRGTEYVRAHGNGDLTITHVLWVEGHEHGHP
jgi:hypothetical protein